jgi:hypothetical protein
MPDTTQTKPSRHLGAECQVLRSEARLGNIMSRNDIIEMEKEVEKMSERALAPWHRKRDGVCVGWSTGIRRCLVQRGRASRFLRH